MLQIINNSLNSSRTKFRLRGVKRMDIDGDAVPHLLYNALGKI